jgi:nucleotide-binding universal stress UspA family protein
MGRRSTAGREATAVTSERLFHRVVVPTDFSSCAEAAWDVGQRLAAAMGSELVLTHVLVDTPLFDEGPFNTEKTRRVFEAAKQWAEENIERWAAAARAKGLNVRTVLRTGTPHGEIVALATDERAALVVLGTHGRGGLDRALLGSVADRVVRLAPCPVLTVREPS